ncbi:MAG: hypothetical protein U5J96_18040 [Ignavibacteriaceae bacterium]|nr:hypothetical protein [Ignavibacteriaceae bacterium]
MRLMLLSRSIEPERLYLERCGMYVALMEKWWVWGRYNNGDMKYQNRTVQELWRNV